MVGVLILVHEDVTEPVPIVFAHLRAGLEQFHGAHDQIVEVDCVGERQTMLVFGVDDGDQFVDVAGAHLVSALSRDVIAVRFFSWSFQETNAFLQSDILPSSMRGVYRFVSMFRSAAISLTSRSLSAVS